jgi:hypothetical protein
MKAFSFIGPLSTKIQIDVRYCPYSFTVQPPHSNLIRSLSSHGQWARRARSARQTCRQAPAMPKRDRLMLASPSSATRLPSNLQTAHDLKRFVSPFYV